MRPRNDITVPDPDEILHHVRQSAARWQETAERLRRQRDEAQELAARYREALEEIAALFPSPGRLRAQAALDGDPDDESPEIARPGEWETTVGIGSCENSVSRA